MTDADGSSGNLYLEPGSRSAQLHQRARAVMPGGNSRTTVFTRPYPDYVASAQGASVTDVEGQTRIDFVNNYTALIHGHAHPRIIEAVAQQLPNGTAMSFPTHHEIRLAELLVERVGSIDQIRFTNSGTEAVMMAVQTARAFTGRRKIARFEGCYHGAYDFGDFELPFNDADAVEQAVAKHGSELAAVVVDPLPHRPGFVDPRPDFLTRLREVTQKHDVLLISDEIISFRLDYNGPQQRYNYAADLTTLAKIIGGGFPVGAFGGRAEVMAILDPSAKSEPRLTHGGTFNANPVTMVAGHAAMEMLPQSAYTRLSELGDRLRVELADVMETRGVSWQVTGQSSLFKLHPHPRPIVDYQSSLTTPPEQNAVDEFYMAMLGEGYVLTPELAGALSTPMTEREIDGLVAAADKVVDQLQSRRAL